jgi:hypothetical protein
MSMKFPPLIWTPEAELNRGMGVEIEDEERTRLRSCCNAVFNCSRPCGLISQPHALISEYPKNLRYFHGFEGNPQVGLEDRKGANHREFDIFSP